MYRCKTNAMKNISIPEPCSENWNEMTPTEKGAFCQKCALEVIDFTNKSGDEIRDILALNIGSRVCGHIQPKQLDQLNDDFQACQLNTKQSFNRVWIFSLLVVFGLTLFSCEEDEAPVIQSIQHTAQSFFKSLPKNVEVRSLPEVEQIPLVEPHVIGQMRIPENLPVNDVNIDMKEIVVVNELTADREEIVFEMGIEDVDSWGTIDGVIAVSRVYAEHLIDVTEVETEEAMSALVYPNPASNQTTVKVEMPTESDAEIQLFALNGQHIRTIHSGSLSKGETEFLLDLTQLDTGTYLVVIYTDGEKETVRFSKI
jgi:hypothetical protein